MEPRDDANGTIELGSGIDLPVNPPEPVVDLEPPTGWKAAYPEDWSKD